MKGLFVILAVAAASAEPQFLMGGHYAPMIHHAPLTYIKPAVKPVAVEYKKAEEIEGLKLTNPTTYTTVAGFPWAYTYANGYPYAAPTAHKFPEMPEVQKDYAMKGQYEAVAAGGVVHKAKREADPLTVYSTGFPWAYPAAKAYHVQEAGKPEKFEIQAPEFKKVELKKVEYKTVSPIAPVVYKAPAMTYTTPMVYNTPMYTTPMVYSHPMYMPAALKTYSNDNTEETPEYAMKGKYVANAPGALHIAKREAEADPWVLYNSALPYAARTVYSTPYTTAYPYSSLYNYNAFPYSTYRTAFPYIY